jgi:hypothetical protein
MINTEPELIAWLRQQIERDIRVMKQALTWPPRKPGLQDLLQSVLEWRRGKETSALRAETEERLPNRRMLLRILDEHPHDRHLGCVRRCVCWPRCTASATVTARSGSPTWIS